MKEIVFKDYQQPHVHCFTDTATSQISSSIVFPSHTLLNMKSPDCFDTTWNHLRRSGSDSALSINIDIEVDLRYTLLSIERNSSIPSSHDHDPNPVQIVPLTKVGFLSPNQTATILPKEPLQVNPVIPSGPIESDYEPIGDSAHNFYRNAIIGAPSDLHGMPKCLSMPLQPTLHEARRARTHRPTYEIAATMPSGFTYSLPPGRTPSKLNTPYHLLLPGGAVAEPLLIHRRHRDVQEVTRAGAAGVLPTCLSELSSASR
ncbi:hypothetical protein IW262DRAFT_1456502 [Armillaria fumosa]|nr:hypothetical protein IW262DRAFT_1456502 [Armillaria fumosa]